MERSDLLPQPHRLERLFLLDLLGARPVSVHAAASIDPAAFLAVTPKTLLPFLHWRLGEVSEALPPSLRTLLAEHYRENALRHLLRIADLRKIDALLRAEGIRYLLLKGPVLAATVYPAPAARTMLDVDLLMSQADMPRAMAVLGTLGYEVPPRFAGTTIQAGDAPPLFNGQAGSPVVELHALLDSAPEDTQTVEELLEAPRIVDLGHGLAVPTLPPAEFFAHVVTHVSRHHRFEGELRSLLDVALLLPSADADFDWITLRSEWDRRRITAWIELTLSLVKTLFGVPVPRAFAAVTPAPEVMALAAEQLWVDKEIRVSGRIIQALAGSLQSPVHAQTPARPVPMPSGFAGMRLRAQRHWQRARRTYTTFMDGTLRPRTVSRDLALYRNRERLFALVEQR